MRQHKNYGILFAPFIILTASIAALCILVQVLLESSLDEVKFATSVINVAVSQRTLSHKIVTAIAADNLAGQLSNPPLNSLIVTFSSNHQSMLRPENVNADKGLFAPKLANVDSCYSTFLQAILLNADSDTASNGDFVLLLNRQADYIKVLDNYIAAVNGNSDAKIETLRRNELFLATSSLVVISLEVFLIFLPAIKKIKRQSNRFRAIAYNLSHVVRQPIANIKGLLEIVDTATLTGETTEMLRMLKAEADKLDKVIIDNVYNTVEE